MAGPSFEEANALFSRGNYKACLDKYESIIEKYPTTADRALFEMGIIYEYPGNERRDYPKSLECFQKILKDYPESRYRPDSAEMISHIDDVTAREKKIIAQQAEIVTLGQQAGNRESEIHALRKRIEALEQEVKNRENEAVALRTKIEALEGRLKNGFAAIEDGPASKVIVEKKERKLTLLSNGKVLKTYRVALGGNPNSPKERQGDSRTPEGTYVIDSRNSDSRYHLSLHISYPNEDDKKRARELGVSPGGNIMIHGLKNGFSWIGDSHTSVDWTEGCIAVTDEEIEEIARLVPDGTVIEIRP
jgi:tetratricopeptide (TPR) repeat protein